MYTLLGKFNMTVKCYNYDQGCDFEINFGDENFEKSLRDHEIECNKCIDCYEKCDICSKYFEKPKPN